MQVKDSRHETVRVKTEQLSSMSSLTAAAAALVDTTEQKQNDTMA